VAGESILDRVPAAASDEATVFRKFLDVLNLLAPPNSLMSPPRVWRVLARRLPSGPRIPVGRNRNWESG